MGSATIQIDQLENIEWTNSSAYAFTNSNDIWRIRISTTLPLIDNLWVLLAADEQDRANRYYREKDKQRFIISRGALRVLLGKYLKTDPQQLTFRIGENKKPYVKGYTNAQYNVSHSGDYVLIAISSSAIGVDVENIDLDLHYNEIMQISFSPAEIEYVEQSANPIYSFYIFWTRKEALLKATAKGIDDSLKFVPAINGIHTSDHQNIGSDKNRIVKSFNIDDNHIGSIAIETYSCNFLEWNNSFLFL